MKSLFKSLGIHHWIVTLLFLASLGSIFFALHTLLTTQPEVQDGTPNIESLRETLCP